MRTLDESNPATENAVRHYDQAQTAMRCAERLLRPWVVRHNKQRTMETQGGQLLRRKRLVGRQIADHGATQAVDGIPVETEALLPSCWRRG